VRGQAMWPGISASMRFAGKAELTGWSHGAARGSGRAGETVRHAEETGPRGREGKGHAGEGNWCRQNDPTGQRERGRERARRETAADRWNPPVWRRGRAAWLGRFELKWFSLFFQGISNCFFFLFSVGFSIQIQTKFQIQTNSNMCNNSKNI
jgi:hypothetical protein